jgi:predicted metal-binding protein
MKANFIVSGQMLLRATNEQKVKLASHNKKIIAAFEFRTDEWKNKVVYALFTYKNHTWKKVLGADKELAFNECYIPAEVLMPGSFSLTLYCDDRYVSLPCRVEV